MSKLCPILPMSSTCRYQCMPLLSTQTQWKRYIIFAYFNKMIKHSCRISVLSYQDSMGGYIKYNVLQRGPESTLLLPVNLGDSHFPQFFSIVIQCEITAFHTLCVHSAHAAANLNSGYSKYAKVARVHYFCTIALRTCRAVLTRA